jgi:hypothetical protein
MLAPVIFNLLPNLLSYLIIMIAYYIIVSLNLIIQLRNYECDSLPTNTCNVVLLLIGPPTYAAALLCCVTTCCDT